MELGITAVLPEQQGKGLVGLLVQRLEEELKATGYTSIERDCMVGNGYAQTVYDFYNQQERIDYFSPVFESSIGQQVHFRVQL